MIPTPVVHHHESVVHLGFCIPVESEEHLQEVGHRNPNFAEWDGGQVGGTPNWLDPEHIPEGPLQCRNCTHILRFVAQIYAPIDEEPQAFHRSLYVFVCPHCCGPKTNNGNHTSTASSVRVLRVQLPAQNPYYFAPDDKKKSTDPPQTDSDNEHSPSDDDSIVEVHNSWNNHLPVTYGKTLCKVCGLFATKKCPVQQEYFCDRQHQKEYKKFVYDNNRFGEDMEVQQDSSSLALSVQLGSMNEGTPCLPSVYTPVFQLVVEDEPPMQQSLAETMEQFQIEEEDDEDSDKDLEQDDLNDMVGDARNDTLKNQRRRVRKDPITQQFLERIQNRKNVSDQCLRYCRWKEFTNEEGNDKDESGGPLWIRSDQQPPEQIPSCPHCGSERKFEFQIMPQMLDYLLKDRRKATAGQGREKDSYAASMKQALHQTDTIVRDSAPEMVPPALVDARERVLDKIRDELLESKTDEIDWGVIAVYTCTQSCTTHHNYAEEYGWKQQSIDF